MCRIAYPTQQGVEAIALVENLLALFVDQASALAAGDHVVPHCNAMAIPFVCRLLEDGPSGAQQLVTWELQIDQ